MTATATPSPLARQILDVEPAAVYALVDNQPAIVVFVASAGSFRVESVRFDRTAAGLTSQAELRVPIFRVVDYDRPDWSAISFVESTALAKLVELAGPQD